MGYTAPCGYARKERQAILKLCNYNKKYKFAHRITIVGKLLGI
jgi:hypothetical protein